MKSEIKEIMADSFSNPTENVEILETCIVAQSVGLFVHIL